MWRRIFGLIFSALLLLNTCGCAVLLVGAAGTVGTAAWLSGKLSQEVDASLDKSLKATKSALKSLNLNITKETITRDIIQVMSNYMDGKTIWIDIRRVSDSVSRIEVRVGVPGEKETAREVLNKIIEYLKKT